MNLANSTRRQHKVINRKQEMSPFITRNERMTKRQSGTSCKGAIITSQRAEQMHVYCSCHLVTKETERLKNYNINWSYHTWLSWVTMLLHQSANGFVWRNANINKYVDKKHIKINSFLYMTIAFNCFCQFLAPTKTRFMAKVPDLTSFQFSGSNESLQSQKTKLVSQKMSRLMSFHSKFNN